MWCRISLGVYDIHGFVVAVEGPADELFSKEFGYFIVSNTTEKKVDLFIKVNKEKKSLPTQFWGLNKGLYIPFNKDENVLLYDEGVEKLKPQDRFLDPIEILMWWPDKTRVHAGAVAKNGKAYVFTGEGGVGKTTSVLNLLQKGCEYLSEDWLIIGRGKAFPFPKRIHIFDYNLKHEEIAKKLLGRKRLYYRLKSRLLELGERYSPHIYIRYIFNKLNARNMLIVELKELFPEAKVGNVTSISKVFLLERRKVPKIEIKEDITPEKLARRMACYNMYEWHHMFREYYYYSYLFGIKNEKIENRLNHDIEIMTETFGKAELYRVIIPESLDLYNVDLVSTLEIG
ncbi:MAG: hypothetical protein QXG39_02450 [Candidatus Aenigmatarchaeota archaeon]